MMIIIPKEVFIGMVFAVGATLTGHTWSGDFFPDAFFSPSVIIFGILCSMNCIAISIQNITKKTVGYVVPGKLLAVGLLK